MSGFFSPRIPELTKEKGNCRWKRMRGKPTSHCLFLSLPFQSIIFPHYFQVLGKDGLVKGRDGRDGHSLLLPCPATSGDGKEKRELGERDLPLTQAFIHCPFPLSVYSLSSFLLSPFVCSWLPKRKDTKVEERRVNRQLLFPAVSSGKGKD